MYHKLLLLLFFCLSLNLYAQDSIPKKHFEMSAHGEVYYSYSFNKPNNHEHSPLFYNYKRANEVNVNIAFVSFRYNNGIVRSNASFMVGTYPEYNTIIEQDLLRHVYEANAGFKISKSKDLWIDAGVMPSHIGFESAYGKDCYTLTRSLVADNSPYYEAGAKISYFTPNRKFKIAAMVLNGWQRIAKKDNNSLPSVGSRMSYLISKNHLVHWNTYIGNEGVDTAQAWRYYSNIYLESTFSERLKTIIGFDYGRQETPLDRKKINHLFAPVIVAQYKMTDKLFLGSRIEYYKDPSESFAITGTGKGVNCWGVSSNLDVYISKHLLFRTEAKLLHDQKAIFTRDKRAVNDNFILSSSIVFWIL
jgi:hypothetical protein